MHILNILCLINRSLLIARTRSKRRQLFFCHNHCRLKSPRSNKIEKKGCVQLTLYSIDLVWSKKLFPFLYNETSCFNVLSSRMVDLQKTVSHIMYVYTFCPVKKKKTLLYVWDEIVSSLFFPDSINLLWYGVINFHSYTTRTKCSKFCHFLCGTIAKPEVTLEQ